MMNLATDKWIPVLRRDGRHDEVSLTSAYTEGDQIADLAVRPPERIALMRLLLCVAHAALDPAGKAPRPRDEADWRDCRAELPSRAEAYLKKWHSAFELFGLEQRFLQVTRLVPLRAEREANWADKLDLALATGNNTTLFDNAGGSDRTFTDARLALMLVTFQSFSPCGRIGLAKWNGIETAGGGSSNHAVCASGNALHAFLRQATLSDTVYVNLINHEDFVQHSGRAGTWGRPIWEAMPTIPAARPELTRSYLGRLAPLCRAVRIEDDRKTMILANGLEFPAFDAIFPEPSTTVVTAKDGTERRTLSAQVGKALWRQLSAVTVLWSSGTVGGPLALRNILDEDRFDLWVGGLVAAGNAKVEDCVEAVFHHLPVDLTTDAGQRRYTEGVNRAERWATRLGYALAEYRRRLKDEIERGETRKRGLRLKEKAATHFWTAAENRVATLLRLVTDVGPEVRSEWDNALLKAAHAAYDVACPYATSRQMKAYVLGRAVLLRPEPASDTGTETETEDTE